jgi:hypothetical protein
MRIQFFAAALLVLLPAAVVLIAGCQPAEQAQAQSPFAAGAFPPTLSDTDYHRRSWTRADCLACHETGVKESPVMRHVSVPALAKDAKCRTCHVFVAGSEPKQ